MLRMPPPGMRRLHPVNDVTYFYDILNAKYDLMNWYQINPSRRIVLLGDVVFLVDILYINDRPRVLRKFPAH